MGESNDADQWPPKGHCACKFCERLYPSGTLCGCKESVIEFGYAFAEMHWDQGI